MRQEGPGNQRDAQKIRAIPAVTPELNNASLPVKDCWSRDGIRIFLKSSPNWKIYLDALPDLVQRGIKRIHLRDKKIIAEASGPDETLAMELHANARAIIKMDSPFRQSQWDETKNVDPMDLQKFRLYYELSMKRRRGHTPPGS